MSNLLDYVLVCKGCSEVFLTFGGAHDHQTAPEAPEACRAHRLVTSEDDDFQCVKTGRHDRVVEAPEPAVGFAGATYCGRCATNLSDPTAEI